jgi:flagellar motor switch protein FliG
MTNSSQDNSLRKVAILVASLEETLSDQVLDSLSPQQARSVRQQLELLTDIDPEEQREIVAEFRRSLAQPIQKQSSGVELDASLLERIDHDDYSAPLPTTKKPFETISAADTEYLVEMLTNESAQTIAVVLARLDAERAAEVLGTYPPSQQHEILRRLAELDTTDEHSIQLIEAQVTQWIANQRERRRRMMAGKEMVDRIVSRTSQGQMANQSTVVAARLPKATSRIASEYLGTSPAASRETGTRQVRYEPLPTVPQNIAPQNPYAHLSAAECLAQLENMPDATLIAALSQTESHLVSLALVGVSEKLLKRVLRGLSRREALQFRQQLRDIGPTRISDILAAQQEILHTAAQLT